jgi:hypothetical protein
MIQTVSQRFLLRIHLMASTKPSRIHGWGWMLLCNRILLPRPAAQPSCPILTPQGPCMLHCMHLLDWRNKENVTLLMLERCEARNSNPDGSVPKRHVLHASLSPYPLPRFPSPSDDMPRCRSWIGARRPIMPSYCEKLSFSHFALRSHFLHPHTNPDTLFESEVARMAYIFCTCITCTISMKNKWWKTLKVVKQASYYMV